METKAIGNLKTQGDRLNDVVLNVTFGAYFHTYLNTIDPPCSVKTCKISERSVIVF